MESILANIRIEHNFERVSKQINMCNKMEVEELHELLKNKTVQEIICRLEYYENRKLVHRYYSFKIKELISWRIDLDKYLTIKYSDFDNKLRKEMLIIPDIQKVIPTYVPDAH